MCLAVCEKVLFWLVTMKFFAEYFFTLKSIKKEQDSVMGTVDFQNSTPNFIKLWVC